MRRNTSLRTTRIVLLIGLMLILALALPAIAAAATAAGDDQFDWSELVGGLGVGSGAGAIATAYTASRNRKADERRRKEDLQREASDRVAQDIKVLAGDAARTQRPWRHSAICPSTGRRRSCVPLSTGCGRAWRRLASVLRCSLMTTFAP